MATSSRATELRDEAGTSCARDPPPFVGQLRRETNARYTPNLAVAERTTVDPKIGPTVGPIGRQG